MEVSIYEAVAAAEVNRSAQELVLPASVLVIDTGQCGAGLCRCCENGEVTLLCSHQSGSNAAEMWDRNAGKVGIAFTEELLTSQPVQSAMWNYYNSGRVLNGELPGFEGVCASMLDSSFSPVRAMLNEVLDRIFEHMDSVGISSDQLGRIVIIGTVGCSAPAQLTIRERLTFDPLLSLNSDKRFVLTADPKEMAAAGRALLAQFRPVGVEASLLLVNGSDESTEKLVLFSAFGAAQPIEAAAFCRPIYVTSCEQLSFLIGEQVKSVPLPYEVGGDGDLVELRWGQRDGQPAVILRRVLVPTESYELDILKGVLL